jgi:hypothetical protein
MAPKSQPIMDNRSAADKRRDTINKKKLEEQAHLRQIEAAGKGTYFSAHSRIDW